MIATLLVLFAPMPFSHQRLVPGVYEFYEGSQHLRLALEHDGTYYVRTFDHKTIHRGEYAVTGYKLELFRNKLNGDGPVAGKKVGWLTSTAIYLKPDGSKQWRGWGYDDTSYIERRLMYRLELFWTFDKKKER